jgi:hypothetical protein
MTKNFAANMKIGAMMGSSVGRVFNGVNKKVKEQEATLKKLRSAYADAAKGSGAFVGSLAKMEREITSAEAKLKRLQAAAKIDLGASMKGVGSKFWGDTKRLGMVGGVMGAAGLGIAKNMLDITADFEKQLALLKTLEGSEEKAQQAFGWIQEFAQKTPYELSQVTEAFARLKAFGIDPIRGDSLRVLGDAASGMSKDIMQLVDALADAQMGQNERLMELGIRGEKNKDKITYFWEGKDGKSLSKTVDARNKALIRSTLLAIWNSKYKGAMDEQSKTWNGMVSNLKDTWARFAFDVMKSGPFEQLKNQLQGFLDKVAVWSKDGTMKRWAEQTGAFMVDAGTKIGAIATTLYTVLDSVQDFLGGWDKLVYAIIGLNFAPTIAAFGSLTASLWTVTGASWAAVGPWLALAAAIGAAYLAWTNLETMEKFWDAIIPYEWQAAVGLAILTVIDKIGELYDKFINFHKMLIDGSLKAAKVMGDAFIGVFNWIGEKIDMVLGKIEALGNGALNFGKKIGDFFGFGGGAATTTAPITPKESMPGNKTSMNQNNNFNINVNAPGADGRRIADQLRSEFNRKPLYDMDSFAPAQ